jgi:hypothetical protein
MIGRVAMVNTQTRKAAVITQRKAAVQTKFSTATNMDVLIDIAMSEEETVDVFETVGCELDFRQLYQSCHIHETLGRVEEFKTIYEEKRKVCLNLIGLFLDAIGSYIKIDVVIQEW